MRIRINLTIILIVLSSNIFAQVPYQALENFHKFTIESIKKNLFKDSTAFYAFNIQIVVDKNKDYIPVITNNNENVANQLIGLEALQTYDYKDLMGDNERVSFIMPVAIIIYDTKYNKTMRSNIDLTISKLFYYPIKDDDNLKIIYLYPVIIAFDKKIYH